MKGADLGTPATEISFDAISADKSYEMAFQMLCKYADMSVGMRTSVFVQGLVILSGVGYLILNKHYGLSAISSAFCICVVYVLNIMHDHYNAYFFSVRAYIKYLEAVYGHKHIIGYVQFVEGNRDRRVNSSRFGWIRLYGPFLIIGATAAFMLLFSASAEGFKLLDTTRVGHLANPAAQTHNGSSASNGTQVPTISPPIPAQKAVPTPLGSARPCVGTSSGPTRQPHYHDGRTAGCEPSHDSSAKR